MSEKVNPVVYYQLKAGPYLILDELWGPDENPEESFQLRTIPIAGEDPQYVVVDSENWIVNSSACVLESGTGTFFQLVQWPIPEKPGFVAVRHRVLCHSDSSLDSDGLYYIQLHNLVCTAD